MEFKTSEEQLNNEGIDDGIDNLSSFSNTSKPVFKVSTPNPTYVIIKEENEGKDVEEEEHEEENNSTCERSSLVKYEKQRNVYSFEQRYNLIRMVNVEGMTIRKVILFINIRLLESQISNLLQPKT